MPFFSPASLAVVAGCSQTLSGPKGGVAGLLEGDVGGVQQAELHLLPPPSVLPRLHPTEAPERNSIPTRLHAVQSTGTTRPSCAWALPSCVSACPNCIAPAAGLVDPIGQ